MGHQYRHRCSMTLKLTQVLILALSFLSLTLNKVSYAFAEQTGIDTSATEISTERSANMSMVMDNASVSAESSATTTASEHNSNSNSESNSTVSSQSQSQSHSSSNTKSKYKEYDPLANTWCFFPSSESSESESAEENESEIKCPPVNTPKRPKGTKYLHTHDLWDHFQCPQVFQNNRPVHHKSTWMKLRYTYHQITSKHKDISTRPISTLTDSVLESQYTDGFHTPIQATLHTGKGRTLISSHKIPPWTVVWESAYSASFETGFQYWSFLNSIPRDIACDVIQWAYVIKVKDPEYPSEDDEYFMIQVDLDEGSYMNTGDYVTVSKTDFTIHQEPETQHTSTSDTHNTTYTCNNDHHPSNDHDPSSYCTNANTTDKNKDTDTQLISNTNSTNIDKDSTISTTNTNTNTDPTYNSPNGYNQYTWDPANVRVYRTGEGKLVIVSSTTIEPGQEILGDYGDFAEMLGWGEFYYIRTAADFHRSDK